MSTSIHRRRRWLALLGAGVVAASLFGGVGPASAAAPTNTKLASSTPTIAIGGIAKLKATVKPVTGTSKPTGTVTFREGSVTAGVVDLVLVGTVQTAKLEVSGLAAGNHTFTATYNGSIDFTTSTSLSVTITVGKTPTSTTASSSTPTPIPGQDVKLKAVVKQLSGATKPTGSVTFTEGTTTLGTAALVLVGTVETAKLTIAGGLPLGKHTITASYPSSSTFAGSSSTVDVTVAKGATSSTLTVTPVTTTPGKSSIAVAVKAVAPASGIPSGNVTFVVDNQAPQLFALTPVGKAQFTVTFAVGSTHTVSVSYAGDSFFNASTGSQNFTSS